MPLTFTYTEGVLDADAAAAAGRKITQAFLRWHGLAGNKVMTPNVTMQIQTLQKRDALSGGEPVSAAWLECKTPSFALADRDIQVGFFKEATDIIEGAASGTLPRDRIFTNLVHTVDGSWNLDGRAMTNSELGERIAQG
ncbi:4-oxalocrotonate tautomerase [uncultured Roseibium sp.]|uniref:4-oxalocrotonate tautomerase n=1 Tax=uncultured Roseibium sp. TaxID=1936171 RepID=UPI002620B14B|nr:4-oxalocrotonate tautomerase [uncultured Roseibium sp.]